MPAGTLKLAATGAALLNPLVLGSVSIVLLAHVAGKLSSDFMASREEDAIFQRVAKNVLPWWQVFMRNLLILRQIKFGLIFPSSARVEQRPDFRKKAENRISGVLIMSALQD